MDISRTWITNVIRVMWCAAMLAGLTAPVAAQNQSVVPANRDASQPPSDLIRGAGTLAQPEEIEPIGTGSDTVTSGKRRRSVETKKGLELEWLYSDNVNRAISGEELKGNVIQISPFFIGTLATPTSWGEIYASATLEKGISTSGDSLPGQSYGAGGRISANGDFSILGDQFRIRPNIALSNGSDLYFGALNDNVLASELRQDFYLVSLAPYTKGSLGVSHEYQVEYKTRYVDPTETALKSVSNRLSLQVGTKAFSASGFGWSWRADGGRNRYENDRAIDTAFSELIIDYLFTPRFRVGVGAAYANINELTDAQGENSGFGPSLVWEWRPASSVLFSGRYADTYFGDIVSISLARNTGRWASSLAYSQGAEDNNEAGAIFFQPRNSFRLGESKLGTSDTVSQGLIDRNIVLAAGTPLAYDLVDSPLVYDKTLMLSHAYLSTRSSFLGIIYGSRMTAAVPLFLAGGRDEVERAGVILEYRYKFSRRQEARLKYAFRTVKFSGNNDKLRANGLSLTWLSRLSARLTAGLTLRGSREYRRSVADGLTELAFIGMLEYRF